MCALQLQLPESKELVTYELKQEDKPFKNDFSISEAKKMIDDLYAGKKELLIPTPNPKIECLMLKESNQYYYVFDKKYYNGPYKHTGQLGTHWQDKKPDVEIKKCKEKIAKMMV